MRIFDITEYIVDCKMFDIQHCDKKLNLFIKNSQHKATLLFLPAATIKINSACEYSEGGAQEAHTLMT